MKSGWRYELRRGKCLLLEPIKCADVVDIKSKLRRWELSVSFHYQILGGIPAPSNFGEDWKRRAQGCVVLDRHRANNKGKGYLFDGNGFDYTKVAFMRDTKA
ncbi:hypothetical protein MKW98_025872 [Papaver atlanticum]|uniref:Uncharacterized protein n=1 Tax=Papaver atlanticum TaxID=357466 RepID=A0AAD4RVI0_9MAGN|nr:hypothetical protein MKW98_025872 [Papaver atlanticum]